MRVESMDQFHREIANLAPVTVQSKKHGSISVPCMRTVLVKTELVVANTYNPNHVSHDKMSLLMQSIVDNGFCFPVVTIYDPDQDKFVIIDGFHRRSISGEDWLDLDYLPVVVLSHDISARMAATVQFNKARGVHQLDLDAEVIRALIEQGLSEEDISTKLGMDIESVHRYKQVAGIASLFAKSEYSRSWEMVDE